MNHELSIKFWLYLWIRLFQSDLKRSIVAANCQLAQGIIGDAGFGGLK